MLALLDDVLLELDYHYVMLALLLELHLHF